MYIKMYPEGILYHEFVSKLPVLSLMPDDRAILENNFFMAVFLSDLFLI